MNARAKTANRREDLLPPLDELLVSGGDERLVLNPATGLNRYGCPPRPDLRVLDFASSTASIISPEAYEAVESLRQRLLTGIEKRGPERTWERALGRLHGELIALLGLADLGGLEVLFSPSGTDLHSDALKLLSDFKAVTVILPEAVETGSGVPAAMGNARLRQVHPPSAGTESVKLVALRNEDGSPRPMAEVERDYDHLIQAALTGGGSVLAVVAEVSKTGLAAPTPGFMANRLARGEGRVQVLVDACQARLSRTELRAWLEQGALLALTGSKYFCGPAFSGALLVPPGRVTQGLLESVRRQESRPNFGMLLRWEAALAEMRPYMAMGQEESQSALDVLVAAVKARLSAGPYQLISSQVSGGPERPECGIIPFQMRRNGIALPEKAVSDVYRLMAEDCSSLARNASERTVLARRCRLGQPVPCGRSGDVRSAALRFAFGARHVRKAVHSGNSAVLQDACLLLEKLDLLLSL